MDRIARHLESVRQRIFLSTALFVVFVVVAIIVTIVGSDGDVAFFARLAPAAAAIAVLPRDVIPRHWPSVETEEDQDLLDMMRGQLRALYSRTITMRIVFLGAFLVLMLLLPNAQF